MNPQVENLILLQDIDLMILELGDSKKANAEKKLGFELGDIKLLQQARDEMASSVDPGLLKRYERLRGRYPRAIVPVRDGICLGCFVRRPARVSMDETSEVEICERCSRIIFRLRAS